MTENQFKELSLNHKWHHLYTLMSWIVYTEKSVIPENIENKEYWISTRVERWTHVKNLYAANRDELTDTLNDANYEKIRRILEDAFTVELDLELKKILR